MNVYLTRRNQIAGGKGKNEFLRRKSEKQIDRIKTEKKKARVGKKEIGC